MCETECECEIERVSERERGGYLGESRRGRRYKGDGFKRAIREAEMQRKKYTDGGNIIKLPRTPDICYRGFIEEKCDMKV